MNNQLEFEAVVENSNLVLSRILQVLSRRGFALTGLSTEMLTDGRLKLTCTTVGPERWHATLPALVCKLVEVNQVNVRSEV